MTGALAKRFLPMLIALAVPVTAGASSVLPVGKAEYDFVYDRMERLEVMSDGVYDFQLGPFDGSEARFDFGPFDYLRNIPSNKLNLFSSLGEDFYSTRNESPSGFESLRGGLAASPMEKLFVYGNVLLDERKAEDESYTGKKWRGLAGGVEEAFAYFRTNRFEVLAGRFASFWGPRNSLVLGPVNALDGFEYSYHWGRLVVSYRLAKLDGLSPEEDGVEQFENRFFAGHRLDVYLSKRIRVAFFESIIYGGPGRQVDLLYLNPILFFHADQLNEGIDDNTLLGFDFTYKPRAGVKLYGQVLVDDFQIEKETQGDQEPDQYGVLGGLHLVNLLPELDVKLEYSRVTNWTFNQVHPRNRYLFNGVPLGVTEGNDFEKLLFSGTRWFGDDLSMTAHLAYQRRGEGSPTDEWTSPWLLVEGDYDEPFPTGVVEKTRTASLEVKAFVMNHFFVDIEAGLNVVEHFGHVFGDDRTLPFARLELSSFFSAPVKIDW